MISLLLQNRTSLFWRAIFPTTDRINYIPSVSYPTNNVMVCNIIQYGHMSSGKTETVRAIVEKAVQYYGEDRVNAVSSKEGDLSLILDCGMNNKLVQILILDDFTLRDISKEELQNFFKIRHLYTEQTGNRNGYIISIFNCHRFHGIATGLRTNVDVGLWKTSPTNPYDKNIIKKFVGEDGIADLEEIEGLRLTNPEWSSVSVFTSRLGLGLLVLPLAERDYITLLEQPPRVEPSTEFLRKRAYGWKDELEEEEEIDGKMPKV